MKFKELFEKAKFAFLSGEKDPDLEKIASRIRGMYTIDKNDVKNNITRNFIKVLDDKIQEYINDQLSNGSWQEFEDDLEYFVEFGAMYWTRPFGMSVAYKSPASRWHGNETLFESITKALKRGMEFTKPGHPQWSNWWASDIGAPLNLGITCHLLYTDLEQEFLVEQIKHLYWLLHEYKHIGIGEEVGTGANAIWVGTNGLRLAALSNDLDLANKSMDIINTHSRVNEEGFGEGLMPDGTWHQHGNGLNMGYGASFLDAIAQTILITSGTNLKISEDAIKDILDFFTFAAWVSFNGVTDIYIGGRSSTRVFQIFDYIVPFLLLKATDNPKFAPLVEKFFSGRPMSYKSMDYHYPQAPTLHARYASLEPTKVTGKDLMIQGIKAYPHSGYMVNRGQNHFISFRCTDENLKSWFSIHDENLKGYYDREGTVFFLTPDYPLTMDQQYNRPWDDRMGVTRVDGYHPSKEQYGLSILTECRTEFQDHLGIMGYIHRQSLGIEAELRATKSYITWDSFFYHCASNVHVQRFKHNSSDKYPKCITSLLTVPLISPKTGNPDHDFSIIVNGKVLEFKPGVDIEIPPGSKGIVGTVAFKATALDSILKAKIVEFNNDPKDVNQQYKPDFIPRPVRWFILYCEHDTENSAFEPGYQVLCDLNASKDDHAFNMEKNWPVLQIEGKKHLINIPGIGKEVRVSHGDSIFDELLEW
ncbi:MAG: hypothetical protein ACFFCS_19520 [Candidatus Hodarchaeota archaeon]